MLQSTVLFQQERGGLTWTNLSNIIPNAIKDMQFYEKTLCRSFLLYLLHPVLLSSGSRNRVLVMYTTSKAFWLKAHHISDISHNFLYHGIYSGITSRNISTMTITPNNTNAKSPSVLPSSYPKSQLKSLSHNFLKMILASGRMFYPDCCG